MSGDGTVSSVPDPGQLVEVRRRQWVVTDVVRSALPPDPLRPVTNGAQHLVRLSSVEEDGLGEELQVVWELEPGARVHEKALLPEPTGFDDPARFDAFLDAVRWGAVAATGTPALQSPFRSGIAIEEYQLDPVVRALQMPRVNLLIADDVGLGKTIEAGLVAQELILRHRVRSILVVCPASLQIKWRDEMRDRFGLEFRIVDSESMKDLRRRRGIRVNPWTHFQRLITSIDFLKRERPLRLFREVLPAPGEPVYPRRFDLLILDEAHHVAPAGLGRYATDSDRTEAIRTLAPHFEHKLFLTATPHNGYLESFTALLELLDDQRFARTVKPDPRQLEVVLVHRLKSEIVNRDGTKRFPERKLEAIEVAYTPEEREAHLKLQRYCELRQRAADDEATALGTDFVLKLLKKRMFSSPAAFLATLVEHEKTLRGLRDEARTDSRSTIALRRELSRAEEDWADDEQYETATGEAVGTATTAFAQLGEEERRLLRELRDWAERATARADAKAQTLVSWLERTLRPEGEWNDDRVIIFTEYLATQKWLQDLLARHGFASQGRLMTLYGGMDDEERERIKAAFQAHPIESPVRILLATDAASEGIDLQRHCHRLIHYEIPWNPTRLEQRNGRVDRHGQKAEEVLIYHFVATGWSGRTVAAAKPGDLEGDLEFLMRAALKVEAIRQDLGKVGPVIADRVERAMLGRPASLDTTAEERDAQASRRLYRFERNLRERIAKLADRLNESRRDLRVSPETLQAVIETALELAGQPPLKEAGFPGIWPDPTGRRTRCPVFHLPLLRDGWARCSEGLEHPHTRKVRPVVFDHDLAAGRDDDVVLIHLNHRLAQMAQRLLRAEVWSRRERAGLHRVTACLVPDEALDTPAVVAHGRLVVLGGDDRRLHEEIISAGAFLREGRLSRMNVGQTEATLRAARSEPAPDRVTARFVEVWPRIRDGVMAALEARMRERTGGLQRQLKEQRDREITDLRAILEELARTIREELATPPPLQQDLPFAEKRQLELNRDAIRVRLDAIPDEMERESAQIRSRYVEMTPRLFPVAVTFLVPERLAR
jgi:superfamily II DNA or RNA helicase